MAGLLMAVASPVSALELGYNLGYRLEYSDNVNRTPGGEIDSWANALVAGLQVTEGTRELELRATAAATYRVYSAEDVGDEAIYSAGLFGRWHIVPQTLVWIFEDYLATILTNPLVSDRPGNRQRSNAYSTGPDLYVRVAPLHTLQLGARAGRATFSEGDADSSRAGASATWLYRVSHGTQFTLGAAKEEVEFDNPVLNRNFERLDQTATMSRNQPHGRLNISAGVTTITYEDGRETEGARGQISWHQELSGATRMVLGLSRELNDAGRSAAAAGANALQTGPLPVGASATVAGGVYQEDVASAGFVRGRAGGSVDEFSVFKSRRQYDSNPALDETGSGASAASSRYIAGNFSGSMNASYIASERLGGSRTDRDATFGAGVVEHWSRSITLNWTVTRYSRTSSDPLAEYVERRFVFAVNYQPQTARRSEGGANVP